MRKLLTISAVLVTLMLGSCVKKVQNTPPSPVAAGIDIFNFTRLTTMASIDPVNVAVRLNLLLDAAAADGDLTYENLSDLKVTSGTQEINVKSYLFEGATVTPDTDKKIWTINYSGSIATNDNTRYGSVIINTGGLRLSENTTWTITTSTDLRLIGYNDMYGNYYTLQQKFASIGVSSSNNGQSVNFNTIYKGYVGENSSQTFDWSSAGTITFGEFRTFAKLLEDDAQYSLMVNGSGKPYYFFSQCDFYTSLSEPLVYAPSCGWKSINSGRVSASFDNYIDYIDAYPAQEVDCQYIPSASTCGTLKLKVDYNDFTETFDLR